MSNLHGALGGKGSLKEIDGSRNDGEMAGERVRNLDIAGTLLDRRYQLYVFNLQLSCEFLDFDGTNLSCFYSATVSRVELSCV